MEKIYYEVNNRVNLGTGRAVSSSPWTSAPYSADIQFELYLLVFQDRNLRIYFCRREVTMSKIS